MNPTEKQNDLGLLITEDLKWNSHTDKVTKKAMSMIYLIKRVFKNLSIEGASKIYKTYVRPMIEYAIPVWNPQYKKNIESLEQIQRKATKISSKIRKFDYPKRMEILNLTTHEERRLRGDLIEIYKLSTNYYSCFNTEENEFLTFNQSSRRGHQMKLTKERTAKNTRSHFLTNRVFNEWNSLPERVIESTSVNQFKTLYDKCKKQERQQHQQL
uniref:Uncharacterized protein n=2 Tax=Cacopsylla melanoneura TaxID=428564 RepID=A0A8D8TMU7_9HEMI